MYVYKHIYSYICIYIHIHTYNVIAVRFHYIYIYYFCCFVDARSARNFRVLGAFCFVVFFFNFSGRVVIVVGGCFHLMVSLYPVLIEKIEFASRSQ